MFMSRIPARHCGRAPATDYSPLLLRLSFLGSGEAWKNPAVLSVCVLFFLSLATLPPAERPRDQAILLLAALSSSIWLGIERGNVDLALFLMVIAALNLGLLALPCRLAGYALLIFAGLLKFYPFVSLIVVLRERVSVLIGVALGAAAALLALVLAYHQELGRTAANLPTPSYMNLQFGAANLAVLLGVTAANILRLALHYDSAAARAAGAAVTRAALPILTVLAILGAVTIGRRCRLPAVLPLLSERLTGYLVVGAALICGCFFAVNSHVFRGMYLLLALPGLAALSREVAQPMGQRFFGTVCIAIPFVLWQPFFDMCLIVASHWRSPRGHFDNPYDAFPGFTLDYLLWLASELAWWWIITVLLAILGAFVLRSEAWALLCRGLPFGISRWGMAGGDGG